MSLISLLDVNVLVAMFDPDHVHHDIAHDWFSDEGNAGWATCPITETGFLRTANGGRKATLVRISDLIAHLAAVRAGAGHHFWADDVTFGEEGLFNAGDLHGRRQVTDTYLLALAVNRGGRLVTFDHRIPRGAVKRARPEHLVVLAPAE